MTAGKDSSPETLVKCWVTHVGCPVTWNIRASQQVERSGNFVGGCGKMTRGCSAVVVASNGNELNQKKQQTLLHDPLQGAATWHIEWHDPVHSDSFMMRVVTLARRQMSLQSLKNRNKAKSTGNGKRMLPAVTTG